MGPHRGLAAPVEDRLQPPGAGANEASRRLDAVDDDLRIESLLGKPQENSAMAGLRQAFVADEEHVLPVRAPGDLLELGKRRGVGGHLLPEPPLVVALEERGIVRLRAALPELGLEPALSRVEIPVEDIRGRQLIVSSAAVHKNPTFDGNTLVAQLRNARFSEHRAPSVESIFSERGGITVGKGSILYQPRDTPLGCAALKGRSREVHMSSLRDDEILTTRKARSAAQLDDDGDDTDVDADDADSDSTDSDSDDTDA